MEQGVLCWYAVQVRTRYEKRVSIALQQKGYEEFLPLYHELRQWSDRVKDQEFPLFPGYVFCRFDARHSVPILAIPGVIQIAGGKGTHTPVEPSEIEAIRMVLSAHISLQPTAYIAVGEQVRIIAGPLKGIHGILTSVNKDFRLTLSITLLQRSVFVNVERGWVKRLASGLSLQSYRDVNAHPELLRSA